MRKINARDVIVGSDITISSVDYNNTLDFVLMDIKASIDDLIYKIAQIRYEIDRKIYTAEMSVASKIENRYLDNFPIGQTEVALKRIDKLQKSIDLVLQELKLNPDEWEYKTETKLVKKGNK